MTPEGDSPGAVPKGNELPTHPEAPPEWQKLDLDAKIEPPKEFKIKFDDTIPIADQVKNLTHFFNNVYLVKMFVDLQAGGAGAEMMYNTLKEAPYAFEISKGSSNQ